MPYPIYATKENMINYLGQEDETNLPADIDRLLKRASEIVYYITYGNIRTGDINHINAMQLATCAQVEYWMLVSEQTAISGQQANSFSLGDLSMNFGNDAQSNTNNKQLAQRARQFLNAEGLMYRGLGW